jgi:hypothetical protein
MFGPLAGRVVDAASKKKVMFQVVLLGTGLFLDTIGFHYMVLIFGGCSILLIFYTIIRQARIPVVFVQEKHHA